MMRKFFPAIRSPYTGAWTWVRPSPRSRKGKGFPTTDLTLAEVSEGYDASRYERYAQKVVQEVMSKGKNLLVVGGSGFYLQSFFEPIVDEVVVSNETRAKVEALYENEGIPRVARAAQAIERR